MGAGGPPHKGLLAGAPASLLLCPSSASPALARRGARAVTLTGRGPPPPAHLPSRRPWSLDRPEEGEGREEEGVAVAGSPGPVPRGHLRWSGGPGVGGRGWGHGLVCTLASPQAGPTPVTRTPRRPLFILVP